MIEEKEKGVKKDIKDDDDDDDNAEDQYCPITTPLKRGRCSSSRCSKDIMITENNDERERRRLCRGESGFIPIGSQNPNHHEISNLGASCTCVSSEEEEEEEGDDQSGGKIVGGAQTQRLFFPVKRTSILNRINHLFIKKRHKKPWKRKSRISEIPWAQKIESGLVCFAAFFANILIIGFITSLSIYYVEFKNAFTDSNGLIPLSVFLPTGVFGSVGLLSGMFLNKFGVRITGLAGSILLGTGIGACAFANNVIFLLVFLGVMAGTGCSLLYLSVTMGMCSYFKDKGRLLMPLVTMGEAVGTILFPPLAYYLIHMYIWRGSLLIMSGVMLQNAVCVMMYSVKNLHGAKDKGTPKKLKRDNLASHNNDKDVGLIDDQSEAVQSLHTPCVRPECTSVHGEPLQQLSVKDLTSATSATVNSTVTSPDQTEHEPMMDLKTTEAQNSVLANVQDKNLPLEPVEKPSVDKSTEFQPEKLEGSHNGLYGNLQDENSLNLETNLELDTSSKSEDVKTRQRDILLSIITNKHYVIFLISVFIVSGCINTMLTVLPDFCVHKGMKLSESANIYAIGASGDVIARVIGSWLLFRSQLSSLIIFTVSGIVTGLLIAIYPLVSTFELLTGLSFLVMIHSGLLFSVYPVVVLDFFSIKWYAIAIGLSETVAGLGIVLFGYIIGLITEYNNGNYTVSFYILSSLSVACMLPMLVLYLFKKRKAVVQIQQ